VAQEVKNPPAANRPDVRATRLVSVAGHELCKQYTMQHTFVFAELLPDFDGSVWRVRNPRSQTMSRQTDHLLGRSFLQANQSIFSGAYSRRLLWMPFQ